MKLKIFATILLAVVAYGGMFTLGLILDNSTKVHEGVVAFDTTQELTEFKAMIAHENTTIRRLDIKSITPPIIVDFEVYFSNNNIDFPYGEIHHDATVRIVFMLVFGTGFFLLGGFILIW